MDAYAIVSVPLLLVTCLALFIGSFVSALFLGGEHWIRRGMTIAADRVFGAILVFTLGYFFWMVL